MDECKSSQSQGAGEESREKPVCPEAESASAAAFGSMILGFFSIPAMFFTSLGIGICVVAVGLGFYALIKIPRGKGRSKHMALTGIVAGLASLYAFTVFQRFYHGEYSCRVNCAENLKRIGQAMLNYAGDNGGFFPSGEGVAGFEMLRKGGYLEDGSRFACPGSKSRTASYGEPLGVETVTYVYLGSGLRADGSPKSVLAFDMPGNHSDYATFLFVDGHVRGLKGVDK